jgi:hypothetical protein
MPTCAAPSSWAASTMTDDVLTANGQAGAYGGDLVKPAPAGDDPGRVLVLEADQPRGADLEEPPQLLGDRVEDVRGRRATRDKGCHAP